MSASTPETRPTTLLTRPGVHGGLARRNHDSACSEKLIRSERSSISTGSTPVTARTSSGTVRPICS